MSRRLPSDRLRRRDRHAAPRQNDAPPLRQPRARKSTSTSPSRGGMLRDREASAGKDPPAGGERRARRGRGCARAGRTAPEAGYAGAQRQALRREHADHRLRAGRPGQLDSAGRRRLGRCRRLLPRPARPWASAGAHLPSRLGERRGGKTARGRAEDVAACLCGPAHRRRRLSSRAAPGSPAARSGADARRARRRLPCA